jgi:DUF1680 family protein
MPPFSSLLRRPLCRPAIRSALPVIAVRCLFALLGILVAVRLPAQSPVPDRRVLQDFNYRGVSLGDGPLKRQFDEVREFYLHIPNDNLLKGFRRRAGRFAPGTEMGGWYSDDVFHIFGQILSGLARMYAATGDMACKAKADALLAGWQQCLEPDGYFYYSRKPNAPHYIYDKMVGGLVDMAVYTGSRDALLDLKRITRWAMTHLDRSNVYAFNAGEGSTEWYTLSENLYRAYLATGDATYRDFAKVWEYAGYWGIYARGGDIFAPRPDGGKTDGYHAYSHVNTLGGAGAAYLVTGKPDYLKTLTGAYDYLQQRECFATGGFGPDELLIPSQALHDHLDDSHASFETQCGTWAVFKMCKYLLELTGDARYGDWIERLAINAIGASIPMMGNGRVFYYSDYNPAGASKVNTDTGWTCCAGTRPMAAADFYDIIYFHTADSLCVNLYTPSSVTWKRGSTAVTLTQSTRFPESSLSLFTVQTSQPARFSLKLRCPGWLAGPMRVRINGSPVQASEAEHWVTIHREWHNGDRVEVDLPMSVRQVRFQPSLPTPTALMEGPVVLALQTVDGKLTGLPLDRLDSAVQPSPEDPLTFRIPTSPNAVVRPFYAVKEGESYFVAIDPALRNRIGYRSVEYHPAWHDGGRLRYSNEVGATATVTFEGRGIRWIAYRFDDGGIAEIILDGRVIATADLYGPGRGLPFDWHIDSLSPGKHTLSIRVTGRRSEGSKDCYLNVAGFDVVE